MTQNLLDPDDSTPPRTVRPWTAVTGHELGDATKRSTTCTCGARQRPADNMTAAAWRETHLSEAWPILVPQRPTESISDWRRRVVTELAAARRGEHEVDLRLGLGRPIRDGDPFPVITDESVAAGERVAVLEHQLEELDERVRSERDR